MNNTTEKTYRYTVTITGRGGDFFFRPMTPEQVTFWSEMGSDALTEHLTGDDDGTPPELALGRYDDAEIQTSGIGFEDEDADFVVRKENGETEIDGSIDDGDRGNFVVIRDAIAAPDAGAFFRTYETSEWRFDLELTEPFQFHLLRITATETPKGTLLNGIIYDGRGIPPDYDEGKEWKQWTAELLS